LWGGGAWGSVLIVTHSFGIVGLPPAVLVKGSSVNVKTVISVKKRPRC
jgi:hypothetical protein